MSYLNFDNTSSNSGNGRAYDFQETYEGFGEPEEDDAFNDETFGVSQVGKDFDFGGSSKETAASTVNPTLSYARAAANDDEFMKDLWGVPPASKEHGQPKPSAPEGKKFLSLEEIEAQLTSIDPAQGGVPPPHVDANPQPGMGPYPPAHFGGGYMAPPQGFMPPRNQYPGPFPGQFVPMPPAGLQNPQFSMQAPQPPQFPAVPFPQFSGAPAMQQGQPVPFPHSSVPVNNGPGFIPEEAPQFPQGEVMQENTSLPARQKEPLRPKENDASQFPVLGSRNQARSKNAPVRTNGSDLQVPDQSSRNKENEAPPMLPEDQALLAKRHDKVSKIIRHSGIMNPKDKDFVTRFQLSQIVTEDPYNEDFYAQVYKVIHPKSPAITGEVQFSQEPNSIAQAYLDHSGHRLGGRFRRADVALQRMQQQVQKAVSVAKERQVLPQQTREGVLGKVSVGSGKKPRQQLVILSKAAQKAKEEESSGKSEGQQADGLRPAATTTLSPPSKSYTKKDIMAILENIINKLMAAESVTRGSTNPNTTELWESLHILDSSSSSGDEASFVNPFIQCLNYEKALKILPRLFNFLTREQSLTVVTLVMSNLENLLVIKDGSYTIYADKTLPKQVNKLVDLYNVTFCKVLMNLVQDFRFHEIIGLLVILIQHNAVSFVSTTRIGLSILTTLLSRAELIKGEGSISATDLSEWTSCYDELFTALESRIAAVFPPGHGDTENDGYIWQFLATLSLGGKLSHQRIIVDEVREEIFGVMNKAKSINNSDLANLHKKQTMLNNLNMYLVVMGLVADENEIQELNA